MVIKLNIIMERLKQTKQVPLEKVPKELDKFQRKTIRTWRLCVVSTFKCKKNLFFQKCDFQTWRNRTINDREVSELLIDIETRRTLKSELENIRNNILNHNCTSIILEGNHRWSNQVDPAAARSHPMRERSILITFPKPSHSKLLPLTLILDKPQMIKFLTVILLLVPESLNLVRTQRQEAI